MVVKFSEDATYQTVASVLNDLAEWVVELDYEDKGCYPTTVMILGATRDGYSELITVCEIVEGRPLRNATWDVPVEGINSITVL